MSVPSLHIFMLLPPSSFLVRISSGRVAPRILDNSLLLLAGPFGKRLATTLFNTMNRIKTIGRHCCLGYAMVQIKKGMSTISLALDDKVFCSLCRSEAPFICHETTIKFRRGSSSERASRANIVKLILSCK